MIERRANTPEEKKDIMKRLLRIWLHKPDLRLGQLIENSLSDVYFTEDYELIERLEKIYLRTPTE